MTHLLIVFLSIRPALLIVGLLFVAMALFGTFFLFREKSAFAKNHSRMSFALERQWDKSDKRTYGVVEKIIDGNYESLSDDERTRLKNDFAKWQKIRRESYRTASEEDMQLLNAYRKRDEFFVFNADISNEAPDASFKIFQPDVFTDPLTSTHDTESFAVTARVTDFFALRGISIDESEQFFVHVKDQFTNHDIAKTILLMDIYKAA